VRSDDAPPVPDAWINPDPGVSRVVAALDFLERYALYYRLLSWFPRLKSPAFAYWYVFAWLSVLTAGLATSVWWFSAPEWVRWLLVVAPVYRLADVVRWWQDLLLDRHHYMVLSFERNFLFLGLNLVELALVGAILLRATGTGSVEASFFDALYLVTQLGLPPSIDSFWSRTAVGLIEVGSLILLLGGLAALVHLLGRKMREAAWEPGDGPSRR
jgi:hypothetical protein